MINELENAIIKKSIKKEKMDLFIKFIFLFIALICASVVIFILIFVLFKGIEPFFKKYENGANQSIFDFFVNIRWKYDGSGGAMFLMLTTLLTTLFSLLLSVPTSVFSALFITRIAPVKTKEFFKTGIELLASIPSVIYGLFGIGVLAPIIRDFAWTLGQQTAGGKSILTASIVLALMSIPTITLVSITSIDGVDSNIIKASLALGASKQQTNYKVILKAASSGIFAGIILGTGRALGEATAVQMVIGNDSNGLSLLNVFNGGSTLTSAMLIGIGEASGLGYDVRFSLGIVLMVVIVLTNILLNIIKNKFFSNEAKKNKASKCISLKFQSREQKDD